MVMDFVSAIFPLIAPLFVVETTRSVCEYRFVICEKQTNSYVYGIRLYLFRIRRFYGYPLVVFPW